VSHERQDLPLRLEARNDLRRIHACFDDLERDLPVNRLRLLGEPNVAHAAFANPLKKTVRPDGFLRLTGR
jgi:hypothetical protein